MDKDARQCKEMPVSYVSTVTNKLSGFLHLCLIRQKPLPIRDIVRSSVRTEMALAVVRQKSTGVVERLETIPLEPNRSLASFVGSRC